jgi:DNA (cytosine-5)-methyltransferase 1
MPYRPEQCASCCWFPCERNYDKTIEQCDWFKLHPATRGVKIYDFDFGPEAPTAIDLFCGCGGASLGFIQAGFNVLCGIDLADDALKTYQMNIGGAIKADVRFLPLREGLAPTLLHWSAPCQGHSTANTKKKVNGQLKPKYQRLNKLMLYGALAAELLQPEYISMENVPPAAKSAEFLEMLFFLKFESSTIYDIDWKILDAADYGVPQHRLRLWLIGRQMKIEGMISMPATMSIAQLNMLTLPDTPLPKDPLQSQLFEFAPEVVAQ